MRVSVPTANDVVVYDATPPLRVTSARAVNPLLNVTVPVGVLRPVAPEPTVAVSVTDVPLTTVPVAEFSTVIVGVGRITFVNWLKLSLDR